MITSSLDTVHQPGVQMDAVRIAISKFYKRHPPAIDRRQTSVEQHSRDGFRELY